MNLFLRSRKEIYRLPHTSTRQLMREHRKMPLLNAPTALMDSVRTNGVTLLIGNLWSANAGYIAMLTMASYFLMYEGLHTLSHLEHPILDRMPLVNTVRRMHVLHHNPDFMHTRNFNLTFPICDALFGTSDLNKGLLGTLFNGMSDEARNEEDQARLRAQQVARAGQTTPAGKDAAGAAPRKAPGMQDARLG